MTGYIVIGLALVPLALLIAAFALERPRVWRVLALFVTSLLVQVGAIIALLALFGALLGLIVPV